MLNATTNIPVGDILQMPLNMFNRFIELKTKELQKQNELAKMSSPEG